MHTVCLVKPQEVRSPSFSLHPRINVFSFFLCFLSYRNGGFEESVHVSALRESAVFQS